MTLPRPSNPNISTEEYQLLLDLRTHQTVRMPQPHPATFGNKIADGFAAAMGSWPFIIIQSALLLGWVGLNAWSSTGKVAWDPYPFILLNLVLSFQAAYAAPIIMMSQNRQATIDRAEAAHDYAVNARAELEIELLHDKMDVLREQEIQYLRSALEQQNVQIARLLGDPEAPLPESPSPGGAADTASKVAVRVQEPGEDPPAEAADAVLPKIVV